MVGAIAAAGAILALMPGPVTFNTFPGAGVNKAQAVFMEMFATAAVGLFRSTCPAHSADSSDSLSYRF